MGLIRFLLLILAAIGVILIIRRIFFRQPIKKSQQSEMMVTCAQCKLYLPKAEAIQVNQRWFCCREHAANYQTKS